MVVRLDDLYFPVQTFRKFQGSSGITHVNYKVYHLLECTVLHVCDYLEMCKQSVTLDH